MPNIGGHGFLVVYDRNEKNWFRPNTEYSAIFTEYSAEYSAEYLPLKSAKIGANIGTLHWTLNWRNFDLCFFTFYNKKKSLLQEKRLPVQSNKN